MGAASAVWENKPGFSPLFPWISPLACPGSRVSFSNLHGFISHLFNLAMMNHTVVFCLFLTENFRSFMSSFGCCGLWRIFFND